MIKVRVLHPTHSAPIIFEAEVSNFGELKNIIHCDFINYIIKLFFIYKIKNF